MTTTHIGKTPKPRRLWAVVARNSLLALLALGVALGVCELVLRLLGVNYPVLVWTDPIRGVAHIPGATGGKILPGGRRWVEINSDGWRGPDVALEHPPGTFRIALLGDSFIEAFEVPFESTVGEVVERRLAALRRSPVEVLNFGEGGYGTTQEYLTLRDEVWKYSPDLVLLAVTTGNDISDNSRALRRGNYVPYHVFKGDRLVLDTSFVLARDYRSRALWTRRMLGVVKHSRLAQLINRVRHLRVKGARQQANAGGEEGDELGLRDEVQLPPTTPEWREAWKVTEGRAAADARRVPAPAHALRGGHADAGHAGHPAPRREGERSSRSWASKTCTIPSAGWPSSASAKALPCSTSRRRWRRRPSSDTCTSTRLATASASATGTSPGHRAAGIGSPPGWLTSWRGIRPWPPGADAGGAGKTSGGDVWVGDPVIGSVEIAALLETLPCPAGTTEARKPRSCFRVLRASVVQVRRVGRHHWPLTAACLTP